MLDPFYIAYYNPHMSKTASRLISINIKKLLLIQWLIVVITSILFGIFSNLNASRSALLGGIAWTVPTLFFVIILFRKKTKTPFQVVINFYLGEFLKLLFSVILVILALKFSSIELLPFFTGYVIAIFAIYLPLLLKN